MVYPTTSSICGSTRTSLLPTLIYGAQHQNVIHRTKSERDYRFTLAQKPVLPAWEHTALSHLAAAVALPKIVAANIAELS